MSFVEERAIKATRKRHLCNACDKWIEPGEAAVNWVGMTDGDFGTAHYHPDCRVAEKALNKNYDWRFGDDWLRLCEHAEPEDYAWLKAEHPVPYLRMMMTREQWAAQVGTRPKGRDNLLARALPSDAVGEADAPLLPRRQHD